MRRRDFIALLATAAVARPPTAHSQQPARPRLVAVLIGIAEDETSQALVGDFRSALANMGWKEGANLRIELRWGGGDVGRIGTEVQGRNQRGEIVLAFVAHGLWPRREPQPS